MPCVEMLLLARVISPTLGRLIQVDPGVFRASFTGNQRLRSHRGLRAAAVRPADTRARE